MNITTDQYTQLLNKHVRCARRYTGFINKFSDNETQKIDTGAIDKYVNNAEFLSSNEYYSLRKFFSLTNNIEGLIKVENIYKVEAKKNFDIKKMESLADLMYLTDGINPEIQLFAIILYLTGHNPNKLLRAEYTINMNTYTVRYENMSFHIDAAKGVLERLVESLDEIKLIDDDMHRFCFNHALDYYSTNLSAIDCSVPFIQYKHDVNIRKRNKVSGRNPQKYLLSYIDEDIESPMVFYSIVEGFIEKHKRLPERSEFNKKSLEWIKLEFNSLSSALQTLPFDHIGKEYFINKRYSKEEYSEMLLLRKKQLGRDPYSTREVYHGNKISSIFGSISEAMEYAETYKDQLKLKG